MRGRGKGGEEERRGDRAGCERENEFEFELEGGVVAMSGLKDR